MKLEKAMEGLEDIATMKSSVLLDTSQTALQLGTEALKRIKEGRKYLFSLRHPLLPGETE